MLGGVIDHHRQRLIALKHARPGHNSSSPDLVVASLGSEIAVERIKFIHETTPLYVQAQSLVMRPAQRDFVSTEQYTAVRNVAKKYAQALGRYFTKPRDQDIKNIWKLCEIIYFTSNERHPLARDIVSWINQVYPIGILPDVKQIARSDSPERHPRYWHVIYKCLVRGQLETLHRLLSMLKTSGTAKLSPTAIIHLDSILQTIASHPTLGFNEAYEIYLQRWTTWRDECRIQSNALAQSLHSSANNDLFLTNLSCVVGILEGSRNQIPEVAENWTDYVSALALYSNPDLQTHQLSYALQEAFDYQDKKTMTKLDYIYINFMTLDAVQGLRHCSTFDWWLTAHLADLLDKISMIDEPANRQDMSLREWFILNFVEFDLLPQQDSYWSQILQYLDSCSSEYGKEFMHLCVPRFLAPRMDRHVPSFASEAALDELYKMCHTYGLYEDARDICMARARAAFDRADYSLAIKLYAKAGDSRRISFAAESLLDHLLRERIQGNLAIKLLSDGIDALGSIESKSISDKLLYLGSYNHLINAKAAGDKRAAASALVSLFNPYRAVPSRFWPIILTDSLEVLESARLFFTRKDISRLLSALEEVLSGPKSTKHQAYWKSVVEERVDKSSNLKVEISAEKSLYKVRISLAKCLAITVA